MTQRERLQAFLSENEMHYSELARAVGVSANYVYRILVGNRPVSDAFRYKFAERFGWRAAKDVLGDRQGQGNRELIKA